MGRLNLWDSHAHMDCEDYAADREEVFRQIEENMAGMINPGCDRTSSQQAMAFADKYPFVYAAIGWHPEEISRMTDEDLTLLRQWSTHPKVVAIGEIGLDYYHEEDAPRPLQKQRFIEQLHLAKEVGLPVIIHDREAHGDCMSILQSEGQGVTGVFHCYSGSWEMAKELVKMGFYLGFGGSSTFKNAVKLQEVLRHLPAERILFETDSPYLTPVPYRGRRNQPTYTELVVENAVHVRGESKETLLNISTQNAHKLFTKLK